MVPSLQSFLNLIFIPRGFFSATPAKAAFQWMLDLLIFLLQLFKLVFSIIITVCWTYLLEYYVSVWIITKTSLLHFMPNTPLFPKSSESTVGNVLIFPIRTTVCLVAAMCIRISCPHLSLWKNGEWKAPFILQKKGEVLSAAFTWRSNSWHHAERNQNAKRTATEPTRHRNNILKNLNKYNTISNYRKNVSMENILWH